MGELTRLIRQIPFRRWHFVERDGKFIIVDDTGETVCEKMIVEKDRYADGARFRYIAETCPHTYGAVD